MNKTTPITYKFETSGILNVAGDCELYLLRQKHENESIFELLEVFIGRKVKISVELDE